MTSISKNIFSAEKVARKKQISPAPFFKQVKPVKPRNLDSIFENSWVQSSKEDSRRQYYSRNNDNLTSLANNQIIKAGSIRVNSGAQDLMSRLTRHLQDHRVQKQLQTGQCQGPRRQSRPNRPLDSAKPDTLPTEFEHDHQKRAQSAAESRLEKYAAE